MMSGSNRLTDNVAAAARDRQFVQGNRPVLAVAVAAVAIRAVVAVLVHGAGRLLGAGAVLADATLRLVGNLIDGLVETSKV